MGYSGYRSQSRCSNCNEYGHNRATCPQIISSHKHIVDMAKKYGVQNPYDQPGFEDNLYVSTGWIHDLNEAIEKARLAGETEDQEIPYWQRIRWEEHEERLRANKQRRGKRRQCSFCGQTGHNARTCEVKKQYLRDAEALKALAQRVVAAGLEEAGLVPGALIKVRRYDYQAGEYANMLAMITGINWKQVGAYNPKKLRKPDFLNNWFGAYDIIEYELCHNGQKGSCHIPQHSAIQPNPAAPSDDPSHHEVDGFSLLPGASVPRLPENGYVGDNILMLSQEAQSIDSYVAKVKGWDKPLFPEADADYARLVYAMIQNVGGYLDRPLDYLKRRGAA